MILTDKNWISVEHFYFIFKNLLIDKGSQKMCLQYQMFASNSLQTLPLHLFQAQIWQSKHVIKHVWWLHQILERKLDRCLNCQICFWNRCTGKIWRKNLTMHTPLVKGETIHRMYRNRDYFGDGSVHDTWRPLMIQTIWCSFFEKK